MADDYFIEQVKTVFPSDMTSKNVIQKTIKI